MIHVLRMNFFSPLLLVHFKFIMDDEIFLMKVPVTVSHINSFHPHFPAERETKQFQILAVILHHTHVFTLALRLCFDFLMQTFQISHNIP